MTARHVARPGARSELSSGALGPAAQSRPATGAAKPRAETVRNGLTTHRTSTVSSLGGCLTVVCQTRLAQGCDFQGSARRWACEDEEGGARLWREVIITTYH